MSRLVTLLLVSFVCITAEEIMWPFELSLPDTSHNATPALLETRQSFYRQTLGSLTKINIQKSDSTSAWEQSVRYEFFNDRILNVFNQYLDASGTLFKKLPKDTSIHIGAAYSPWMVYNRRDLTGSLQGSLDLGPLGAFTIKGFPVHVRGGFSGRTWGVNLPDKIPKTSLQNFYHDQGVFGWFALGDSLRPLGKTPLFLEAHGYAKKTTSSSLLSTIAKGFITHTFGKNDSLMLFAADSIIIGNDGILENAADGKSRFVNTPVRNGHVFKALGGIKGSSRLHIQPALVGFFTLDQNKYPDQPTDLLDRRNTKNSFSLLLSADTLSPIVYTGGISFEFENENKLPGAQFSGIQTSNNADSLAIHNNSYNGYKATLNQTIGKFFPSGAGGSYSFYILRHTTRYPFFFKSGNDTIRTNADNHWLDRVHTVSLFPYVTDLFTAQLTAEYEQSHLVYLRKEKSASNIQTAIWRFGILCESTPLEILSLRNQTSTDVKISTRDFPKANLYNFPPYGRTISNKFQLTVITTPWLSASLSSLETFWDEGSRFDPAYIDSSIDSLLARKPWYYAIERKSWVHELRAATLFSIGKGLTLETGATAALTQLAEFSGNTYVNKVLPGQKRITPFLDVTIMNPAKIALKVHISKALYQNAEDYWDISLSAKAGF